MSLSKEGFEKAVKRLKKINDFTNEVLEKNNIQLRNIVEMDHYGHTYIFGIKVEQENITAEEIIDIVKSTPKENYDKHIDFFGQWPNETRKIKNEYY